MQAHRISTRHRSLLSLIPQPEENPETSKFHALRFYVQIGNTRHDCAMDELCTDKKLFNLVHTFIQRTDGIGMWIEQPDGQPLAYIKRVSEDAIGQSKVDERRSFLMCRLSRAPFLFYRFRNETGIWNIIEEDFVLFGAIEVWQEDSPYPKVGEVRQWLETL